MSTEPTLATPRGRILWLMGPTSAGKTTIAAAALEMLRARGERAIFYDGDEIRDLFGSEHGFGSEQRLKVVSTLVHFADKASEAGLHVIVAALTAHNDARQLIRERLSPLALGYVDCDIAICAERDPKGLYARAKRGEIDTLIGLNTPYVPPENPDLVLNSANRPVYDLAETVVDFLTRDD